jgi:hypothetical protein
MLKILVPVSHVDQNGYGDEEIEEPCDHEGNNEFSESNWRDSMGGYSP